LYFDFIVYGGGLFLLYVWFLYFIIKGIIKK
jgi:hypothetical protein